jgi:glycosyltransferase involved in cell wall biosynthesis
LYVGRLWRGKGLDELFDAFRRLKQDRLDASLLILGDGIDERRYRELGRGIADVVFGGFVQPDELPKWYALADCLVFPTHGDPNGLVVEEAFASGLPVIVTRSAGDIEERVGQAGMVVETGSPDALRRAMARVVLDPSLLQTMTRRTWRVAEDKDVGRYAEDFEVLIREVSEAPARTGMLVWLTKLLGRALSGISRLGQLPLNREAGCGYAPDLEGSRRPRSDPRSAGVEGGVGGRQALRRP